MAFQETFLPYVCAGDTITCEMNGFTVTARIVADDCPDAPHERQDGFWPSLYIGDPGFIGPGRNFRDRLEAAQTKAERVLEAWRKGDWFYCGIVLSVCLEGVTLTDHAASLWGIEANYPESDNAYLTEVAAEMLPDALDVARAILARLRAAKPEDRA
ncbi:hypothetical protein [Hyphomonas oceanitis]|uniref:hypothetical protein n=1 Tax=Hyphomonas oceanitis TaxID=81033 RepID=UPI0030029789